MVRSILKPNWYWVRKKEVGNNNLHVTVRIRWNIQKITVPADDMAKERAEWEYDEQELLIKIPISDVDPKSDPDTQIKQYLENNKSQYLAYGPKRHEIEHGNKKDKWMKKKVDLSAVDVNEMQK